VGLFFSDIDSIKSAAEISAKITHSNDDGINGAVLQALSTHCALRDMNAEEHTKVIQDAARKFEPGNKGKVTYAYFLKNPTQNFKMLFNFEARSPAGLG